jgi:hypothetical protein
MWRLLFIVFLIAHGGVHTAIWATPKPKGQKVPFDPSHSWLLGNKKGLAVALSGLHGPSLFPLISGCTDR